jgi:hypothetical protein
MQVRALPPILTVALAAALLLSPTAGATVFALSNLSVADLGGLTFPAAEVVLYDDVADEATTLLDDALFSGAGFPNVNALHVIDDQNIILSHRDETNITLGGVSFRDGDLVQYNLATDTATLFFSEDLFGGPITDQDIDAFSLLPNGHLVISTTLSSATLGGLTFRDGDLIEYDPIGQTATLLLSEDIFENDEGEVENRDIDAVHVFANGDILFSTTQDISLGSLNFANGDLVLYDPDTGNASIVFSETLFAADENINAVSIPEPSTAILLGVGLAGLVISGRSRGIGGGSRPN